MTFSLLTGRAARYTALRLSAEVAGRALQLVTLIVLARQLGEAVFGELMVGATIGLILGQVADFGLGLTVAGDVARKLSTARSAIATAIVIKVVLLGAGWGLLGAVYVLLGSDAAALGAVLVGAALSLDSFVQFAAMQLRAVGAFGLDFGTSLVPRLFAFLLVTPVALAVPEPDVVGLAWFAAALLASVASIAILTRRLNPAAADRLVARMLLWRSWPVGVAVVLSMLYTRLAIFYLEALHGSSAVATYAVALRVLEPAYLVPAAMAAVFYPPYAASVHDDPSAAAGMLRRWLAVVGIIAICVYAALALVGPPLVVLLFGAEFREAGALLPVLGLVVIPGFLSYLLNQALIAGGQARYTLLVMLGLLAFAVLANGYFIELHGVAGGAVVAVAVELVLLLALLVRLRRGVRHR